MNQWLIGNPDNFRVISKPNQENSNVEKPMETTAIWILDPNGENKQWPCLIRPHEIGGLKVLEWGLVGDHRVTSILSDMVLSLIRESGQPDLRFGFQGNIQDIEMVNINGDRSIIPSRVEGIYEDSGMYLISLGVLVAFTTNGYDLITPLAAHAPQHVFELYQ